MAEEKKQEERKTAAQQEEAPKDEAAQETVQEAEKSDGACETEESGAAQEADGDDGVTQTCGETGDADEKAADAQEEDGEPETDEGGEAKEKKGFFSRKKEKKEDAFKGQLSELQDKLMRQMAEFENFRRRTEKEKASMYEIGAKSVIEKILPVVDNFERGLATVPEESQGEPFVEGMNKIYRQLMTELSNLGVTPIEAVGKEFNPELHNAVMQVEDSELESGTIAQELQKGYLYRDSVVRHSMVAVVQ